MRYSGLKLKFGKNCNRLLPFRCIVVSCGTLLFSRKMTLPTLLLEPRRMNSHQKSESQSRELDDALPYVRSFPRASVFAILFSIAIGMAIAIRSVNIHAESSTTETLWRITQLGSGVESSDHTLLEKNAEVSFYPKKTAFSTRRIDAITEPSSPEAAVATVLSRPSQLSAQISHLDARDVVECYVVTRMAQLEDVALHSGGSSFNVDGVHRKLDDSKTFSSISDATNIPSGPVRIRKSALAFRHRPRVASASPTDRASSTSPGHEHKKREYFELTLEFGPLRSGVNGTAESMPVVHMNMENGSNRTGKYVSWDNKSRLYHSTRISSEWTDAYYMAQITGVVLEKIIQRAVEYVHNRPRYQPFDVVSIPSGDVILRSSGSDDFVSDMIRDLSEFYVDIDPILLPPRHRMQLYVADPPEETSSGGGERNAAWTASSVDEIAEISGMKEKLNANVEEVRGALDGDRAAVFYENFFNCANAIKTGNYSMYPPSPSSIPTSLRNVTVVPSMAPSLNNAVVDASDVVQDQNDTAALETASNTSSSTHYLAGTTRYASALATATSTDDATVAVKVSKAGALLSGDDLLMTSALSSCFSDPRYGIRSKDAKQSDATIAYLYVDGDVFFRLNLTAPYWGVTTVWETVPPPHIRPQGRGDAVDWAILTLILMGALSGVIIMVYQWEKSPLKVKKGGGFPHSALFLTAESIPSSMGGEGRSKISAVSYCDQMELTSPKKKGGLGGGLNQKRKLSTESSRKSEYAKLDLPSSLKKLEMEMETAADVIERPSSRSSLNVSMPKKQVKFESSYDQQLEFSIDDEMAIV